MLQLVWHDGQSVQRHQECWCPCVQQHPSKRTTRFSSSFIKLIAILLWKTSQPAIFGETIISLDCSIHGSLSIFLHVNTFQKSMWIPQYSNPTNNGTVHVSCNIKVIVYCRFWTSTASGLPANGLKWAISAALCSSSCPWLGLLWPISACRGDEEMWD